MLEVRALASHYGRIPALKGIDLSVHAGELVALVGANGAGKTTLLRAISGVQPVSAGEVLFAGTDITGFAPDRRVRLGIVQVPEGRQVFGPLSVLDNLLLGAYTRPRAESADSLERVYALFPALAERRRQPAGTTIFLIDQNARAALAAADRAYVLETGQVVASGTGAALLASPQVQAAYLGL